MLSLSTSKKTSKGEGLVMFLTISRFYNCYIASLDCETRRRVVRRFSALFSLRHQILDQFFILDRAHPRPFKLARPQASFVPTDIGSSKYVRGEDIDDYKDSDGTVLPLELRKRLSEIGWEHDGGPVDQRGEWARMPMSMLSIGQLDHLDNNAAAYQPPSPGGETVSSQDATPQKLAERSKGNPQLLRRKSSGTTRGGKTRAVFVPALADVVRLLAPLLYDEDYLVAADARGLFTTIMKDDPAILGRPVYDMLPKGGNGLKDAITTLRAYMHVGERLAPIMAHNVFNHLAGFVKNLRNSTDPASLGAYAYSIPIMARLATQVSEMSLREIRRSKFDVYLMPSGLLWFPPAAPDSLMFPKSFIRSHEEQIGPWEDNELPRQIVWITMIRTSQNTLFLSLLRRNPQDVQFIRKNFTRLILPTREGAVSVRDLELGDFVPRRSASYTMPSMSDCTLHELSYTLSISYVLLVAQILRLLSRHLNDRKELALYFEGLNRILLTHSKDTGVVTQVMIGTMNLTLMGSLWTNKFASLPYC
jgi:hypothetical protein